MSQSAAAGVLMPSGRHVVDLFRPNNQALNMKLSCTTTMVADAMYYGCGIPNRLSALLSAYLCLYYIYARKKLFFPFYDRRFCGIIAQDLQITP